MGHWGEDADDLIQEPAMAERGNDEPHDILAAEGFALPDVDPYLHHHGPIQLPEDPTGDAEPHDVLAAEEFPMPAQLPHPAVTLVERRGGRRRLAAEVGAGLLALLVVRRLRRR